jgi:hypothetical protein
MGSLGRLQSQGPKVNDPSDPHPMKKQQYLSWLPLLPDERLKKASSSDCFWMKAQATF